MIGDAVRDNEGSANLSCDGIYQEIEETYVK
jgi:hypothetical protein